MTFHKTPRRYRYGVLTAALTVFSVAGSAAFFRAGMAAASKLHDGAVAALLDAPLWFFHANPLGRVLNRFSADVGQVDEQLPTALYDFMQVGIMMAAAITMAVRGPSADGSEERSAVDGYPARPARRKRSASSSSPRRRRDPGASSPQVVAAPWVALALPFAFVAFRAIQREVVGAMTVLKRLDSVGKSPVLAAYSGTLHGLVTTRAFPGAAATAAATLEKALSSSAARWYWWLICNRYMGFRLDLLCTPRPARRSAAGSGARLSTRWSGTHARVPRAVRLQVEIPAQVLPREPRGRRDRDARDRGPDAHGAGAALRRGAVRRLPVHDPAARAHGDVHDVRAGRSHQRSRRLQDAFD